ncbi:hypothetical protein HaLaN_04063, partial [Haematococcus lacustris]
SSRWGWRVRGFTIFCCELLCGRLTNTCSCIAHPMQGGWCVVTVNPGLEPALRDILLVEASQKPARLERVGGVPPTDPDSLLAPDPGLASMV